MTMMPPPHSSGKPKIHLTKDPKMLALAGGVIFVGYYYYHKRQLAVAAAAVPVDTTTAVDTTSLDPGATDYTQDTGDGGYSTAPGGFTGAGGNTYPYGYGMPTGTTLPTSNADWAQQTEAYLSNQGFDSQTVTIAIGKYLSGQALTDGQLSIVQAAIGAFGQPPQHVTAPHKTPVHGKPPVKVPPKPKPPKHHGPKKTLRVKVQAHQTLGSLSQKYYGNTAGWKDIKRVNIHKLLTATATSNIKDGVILTIPNATHF